MAKNQKHTYQMQRCSYSQTKRASTMLTLRCKKNVGVDTLYSSDLPQYFAHVTPLTPQLDENPPRQLVTLA